MTDSIIGSYNSLRDPHLKIHFRKPQIRRHLLKSNIVSGKINLLFFHFFLSKKVKRLK